MSATMTHSVSTVADLPNTPNAPDRPIASDGPVTLLPAPPEAEKGGKPYHWNRATFYGAVKKGLFGPNERVELVNGELIDKVGENAPHSSGIRLSRWALELMLRDQNVFISEQHPIVLGQDSEPEPDLVVVRGILREFDRRHPVPSEVLLLVEVSWATLSYDRTTKAAIYANAGIVEYWILNLVHRQLEVYRNPQNGMYRSITLCGPEDTIAPLVAPQSVIAVADLFPATE